MARSKGRAAKAGAGALGLASSLRSNRYLQRYMEDDDVRENFRVALDAATRAFSRIANGKGPAKALLDDRKVHRDIRQAASSFKEGADGVRKKRKRGRGLALVLLLGLGGAAAAVGLNEGLRNKVLDLVLGAEEEFEYTSTTSTSTTASSPPPPPAPPVADTTIDPAPPAGPVGTS